MKWMLTILFSSLLAFSDQITILQIGKIGKEISLPQDAYTLEIEFVARTQPSGRIYCSSKGVVLPLPITASSLLAGYLENHGEDPQLRNHDYFSTVETVIEHLFTYTPFDYCILGSTIPGKKRWLEILSEKAPFCIVIEDTSSGLLEKIFDSEGFR